MAGRAEPWVITMFRKVTFINEIYIADTQWWWKSAASDILGVTLRTITTYANLYYPANCLFFHLPWLSFSRFHYCQLLSLSFRTLAFLCFLKYVVRFILGLETAPLPFTNSARLWKACRKLSLASFFFSILFAYIFFFCPRLLFLKELLYLRSIHPHVNDRGFYSIQHSIPQYDHDLSRLSWPPDFKITLSRARTSSGVILASSTQVWNFYMKIKWFYHCFLWPLF